MNTFAEAALNRVRRTAKKAGNLAYNYAGGRQFAEASRMSNKIMAGGGGVADVLRNPEYWKKIGSGTLAASNVAGIPGLVRGGIRAAGTAALKAGLRKSPSVATVATKSVKPYRDIFADDALNPYGIPAPAKKALTRTESFELRQAQNAARRQQAAAEAEAWKKSMQIVKRPSAKNIARGSASTAAVGGVSATAGARTNGGQPVRQPKQVKQQKQTFASSALNKPNRTKSSAGAPVSTGAATVQNRVVQQPQRAVQQNKAYSVRSGDTLSSIAAQNKTTVQNILKNNPKLTQKKKYQGGNKIYSGTQLNLGGGK